MSKRYKWYKNGRIFKITSDPEGNIVVERHFSNNVVIKYSYYFGETPRIRTERYYKNGVKHRVDKPAVIYYNIDGGIWGEYFYENGEPTRLKMGKII